MAEEKTYNIKLKKSYLGFETGTVATAVDRGEKVVILIRGNAFPISGELFRAQRGDIYEVVDEAPTPLPPEPPIDPELNAPVKPEEAAAVTTDDVPGEEAPK